MGNSEIWIDVFGFNGIYQISSLGNIRSIRFFKNKGNNIIREITPYSQSKGYLQVCLCLNGSIKRFTIHKLVAEHFIPNPQNKPCINHINSNREDNSIDNLEWVTFRENNIHSIKMGKRKH